MSIRRRIERRFHAGADMVDLAITWGLRLRVIEQIVRDSIGDIQVRDSNRRRTGSGRRQAA